MKLVQMYHGSHLYGTASAASDLDYKGVALPDPVDVLLGRIPKVTEARSPAKGAGEKNQPGDVDLQVFSLHHFIDLALKGETVAVDMLHAPREMCQVWTMTWEKLRDNRHRFYTRSMKSLVGYARSQAAKYGLRGSRLAAAKAALEALGFKHSLSTIGDHMKTLPVGEHLRWREPGPKDNGYRMYEVCGMAFLESCKVGYTCGRIRLFVERYGERAKLAETNQGVDWKAISHAFRAAYQLRAILKYGGFEYPLVEAPYLMDIKRGKYTYAVAGAALEDAIDEVERLAAASSLPDKPDRAWAEEFLRVITAEHLLYDLAAPDEETDRLDNIPPWL